MRHLMLAAASAILVSLSVGAPSPAFAARYCLQGTGWGYPGNCQFSSLRQCRAAASGTNAGCGINPRYAFARQRQGQQPAMNPGWNNNSGWNNSGWNNYGSPNSRGGLVGGSDSGTYRQ
jgi:hypothetical protein